MADVMTISERGAGGLTEKLRAVLLDAENKVPAEALRIVGAIADGYIVESGNNANGYYVRFADGTQVCVMTGSQTGEESSTRYGKQYTFPAAFCNTKNLVLVASPQNMASVGSKGSTVIECRVIDVSTYNIKMLFVTGTEIIALSNEWPFCAIAIGKWK